MISRNEPCWCGSGRKYKQCHRNYDEKLNALAKEGYVIPGHDRIKSPEDIEGVRKSAVITKGIFDFLDGKIVPGISTEQINSWVHNYTVDHGGIPATLNYGGFPKSCCTSVNDTICHGIPSEYVLKDGDIVNIDITTILDGYFSDSSRMYLVGNVSDSGKTLVEETYNCMMKGIEAVKPFQSIDVIGEVIEAYANSKGYSVVRDLGGHGIGLEFHEEPHVNHFKNDYKGMIMIPGMMFTIEPMINEKSYETETLDDDWTVVTIDDGLSAQWEHTVVVTDTGVEILT